MNYKVLVEVVRTHFGPLMEARLVTAFVNRVVSATEKFGPLGLKYMEQERFMTMVLQERQAIHDRLSVVRVCVWMRQGVMCLVSPSPGVPPLLRSLSRDSPSHHMLSPCTDPASSVCRGRRERRRLP